MLNQTEMNMFSVDVEDWFHILDSPVVPEFEKWPDLESRVEIGMDRILSILEDANIKATFFWLGWAAEKYPALLKKCHQSGHEIASHSYAHLLAYKVGREKFSQDIIHSKGIIEDIIGEKIIGFRAPGFGITEDAMWAFDVIREAGYIYDSSIFPSSRGHGGISNSTIGPHWIETSAGKLAEIPMSMVNWGNKRLSLFGGGYLRLAPLWLIKKGIKQLHKDNMPLIVYIHPREADPKHPRLPLGPLRKFKSYVNLHTVVPKLSDLSESFKFCTMRNYFENVFTEISSLKSIDLKGSKYAQNH